MVMPYEPDGKMLVFYFIFLNMAHVVYFIINYLLFNLKDNYD